MPVLRRIRLVAGVPPLLALIMFLIGEAIAQIVFEVITPMNARYAWLAGLVIAAAYLSIRYDNQRLAKVSSFGQPGDAKLGERRGAVVLIGLDSDDPTGSLSKLLARTPRLDHLALVGTPQTAEKGVTDRLRSHLLAAWGVDLDPTRIRVYEHNHVESLADNEHSVSDAIQWMNAHGLAPHEIIVDITKGRRPMGFGALLAADRHEVEAQYLTWAWDTVADRPLLGTEAFKLVNERYPDDHDVNDASAQQLAAM